MGMYTEIYFCTMLDGSKTDQIAQTLCYMSTAENEPPAVLPDHPLFKTERWKWLMTGNSHYFVPESVVLFEFNDISKDYVLIFRSDIKNYSDEIGLFLDWIGPYISDRDMQHVGHYRYEEFDTPTLLYANGGKILRVETSLPAV